MNAKVGKVFKALRRGQGWLVDRPQLMSVTAADGTTKTLTPIGQQSAALDAAIADVTTFAGEQEGFDRQIRGLAPFAQQCRDDLVSHQMVHVATIARVAIPDVVQMSEALRTPPKMGSEKLLAAADAMATAGDKYRDDLVLRGLPADFTAELRASAAAYRGAIDSRGVALAKRRGSSVALDEAMKRGRESLDTLTVLLRRTLKGDRAALAEWNQLRRITLVAVKPDATAAPVVPAPTPAPVSTTPTSPASPTAAPAVAQGQQAKVA